MNEQGFFYTSVMKRYYEKPSEGRNSDVADNLVLKIRSELDPKNKQKLIEDLFVQLQPLLRRYLGVFCRKNNEILARQGMVFDDVYNMSYFALLECIDTWTDQAHRLAEEKTPSHFTSYFFSKNGGLISYLHSRIIRPSFARRSQRTAPVSLSTPVDEDGGRPLEEVISDENSLDQFTHTFRNQAKELGRGFIADRLFSDENPFLSLILILKFGLPGIEKWMEKFDLSLKKTVVRRGKMWKKILGNPNDFITALKAFNINKPVPLNEIERLLGSTRQAVEKKEKEAISLLKTLFRLE